VSGLTHQMG